MLDRFDTVIFRLFLVDQLGEAGRAGHQAQQRQLDPVQLGQRANFDPRPVREHDLAALGELAQRFAVFRDRRFQVRCLEDLAAELFGDDLAIALGQAALAQLHAQHVRTLVDAHLLFQRGRPGLRCGDGLRHRFWQLVASLGIVAAAGIVIIRIVVRIIVSCAGQSCFDCGNPIVKPGHAGGDGIANQFLQLFWVHLYLL